MDKENEPFLEKREKNLKPVKTLDREIMRAFVFHSYSNLH